MLLWRGTELKVGCARSGLQALASTGPSAQAVRLRMLASCSSSWCMMPCCLACMHGVTLQGLRNNPDIVAWGAAPQKGCQCNM